MSLLFVRTPYDRLQPHDNAATKFVRELPFNEVAELDPLHPRDMHEQRKMFAQIAEVAKALHVTPEMLRARLLFETGNFTVVGDMFGKTFIAVNSMSRKHMSDRRLHAFWNDAKEIICADLLPQLRDAAERERLTQSLQGA